MDRKRFIKIAGLSAFAISTSGYTYLKDDGTTAGDCATTTDFLGPFYRKEAPYRNDISYAPLKNEIPLKVVGRLYGADCEQPISNARINVWHCDHRGKYDMESNDFRCRGRFDTSEEGWYWFKTFVPPPYGGRPKHIHFLVEEVEGHKELITQLYFKGDRKIRRNNIMGERDERRILQSYRNGEGLTEIRMDLYLTKK